MVRCLRRRVANEIYAVLNRPTADTSSARSSAPHRRQTGLPITVLAATLRVPYRQLRRHGIGTRADPELEYRAITALARPTATLITCQQ